MKAVICTRIGTPEDLEVVDLPLPEPGDGEIRVRVRAASIKGASAVGVFWGAFVQKEPELHRQNLVELFGWLAEGRLRPHIGSRFPLAQAGAAIRHVMDGKALGKTLVTMGGAHGQDSQA